MSGFLSRIMAVVVLSIFLGTPNSFAQDDDVSGDEPAFSNRYFQFRTGGAGFIQKKGHAESLFLSWNPYFAASRIAGLRLDFGGSVQRNKANTLFYLIYYQVLINFNFSHVWGMEIGGGGQQWLGSFGPKGMWTAGLIYKWASRRLLIWDHTVLRYSGLFLKNNYTHIVEFGFGLDLSPK